MRQPTVTEENKPMYYKVLGNRHPVHGGRGRWPYRRWTERIADPVPCQRGYHLCRREDLIDWLGPDIWVAEAGDIVVPDGNKVVTDRARLVRKLSSWNERSARLFAVDCAESVLHLVPESYRGPCETAIEVARRYAVGDASDEERAAAWAAAWAAGAAGAVGAVGAAGAAARAAARAAWAAWAAGAVGAAGDAAWAAARAAAWAAGAAARATARDAQTDRLFDYLEGRA